MENYLLESKAEVIFINDQSEILFKRMMPLDATVSDVLQLSANITKSEVDWDDIQINFGDIAWLETVHLWKNDAGFSINYHFPKPELNFGSSNPFDKIGIGKLDKKETNGHIIGQFYDEIWARDHEIMAIFESDDLFVEWGGPRNPYLSNGQSELVVNYYYDGTFWLLFEHRIWQINECETITMESIRNNSLRLSAITMEIVNSIVSKLSN